ncbi:hypothetical protein M8C21_031235 [Ambrosia artemisiifolia]|uniref:UVR domain-containing protein n=1 Tax=Ambrosia artemisiifolia TaxID=4212 RepID=A0AAD5BMN0_AMBAR|nr:hypothetical protein M8C21_031235 [Ambrosia artemisiifolia]
MSVTTITASTNSGVCGSANASRRCLRLRRSNGHIIFGTEKRFLSHQCVQKNLFSDKYGQGSTRVEAGWFFRGGGGGDQSSDASSERSESANEDILIFFYQLDLATRVQYALNLEEYEIANQLRNKLNEVEVEVTKQRETQRGLSSKSEAQDKGLSLLRLRADLQNAIENENYPLAAEIRDQISKLEADSLAASIKAQAFEKAEFGFRLGQKVRHKKYDNIVLFSLYFRLQAQIYSLDSVLVDVREDPNLLVAYVPEENLLAPEEPDKARFDHPYASFLFYGVDSAGDFIPVKQLREKYNRPRHEVPYDPQDERSGDDA